MCYLQHTYEQVNSIHSQYSIFQAGHLLTIATTYIKYLSAVCEILHMLTDLLQLHFMSVLFMDTHSVDVVSVFCIQNKRAYFKVCLHSGHSLYILDRRM